MDRCFPNFYVLTNHLGILWKCVSSDVKNRLLDSAWEGEGGMIWENSIETCMLPYVKQIASPGSMHETGRSGPVHWDNPEGWDGREVGGGSGWGTHVHPWLIHVSVCQKPLQYCKVISIQLRLINEKNNNTNNNQKNDNNKKETLVRSFPSV